ncbi:hypothetical protein D1151_16620, partial [Emergencia sp. 1XD21-10]|nr:hypothetical protein [Emergencia sp. 1XD21-10]
MVTRRFLELLELDLLSPKSRVDVLFEFKMVGCWGRRKVVLAMVPVREAVVVAIKCLWTGGLWQGKEG